MAAGRQRGEEFPASELSDSRVQSLEAAWTELIPVKEVQRRIPRRPEAADRGRDDSYSHSKRFIADIAANQFRNSLSQCLLEARKDPVMDNAEGVIGVLFAPKEKSRPRRRLSPTHDEVKKLAQRSIDSRHGISIPCVSKKGDHRIHLLPSVIRDRPRGGEMKSSFSPKMIWNCGQIDPAPFGENPRTRRFIADRRKDLDRRHR